MADSPSLVSKAVLITGCSSGIGKATALHLKSKGHTVIATARKTKDLDELKAAGCEVLALDVTDAASVEAAIQSIEASHGGVGVLVNNAGYSQSGAIEAVPLERVRAQFETNVFGVVRLIQRVLPFMRKQQYGRIVNLSSMGGKLVFPGGGYYHATKYAVEALSDALRFEVQGFGIKVVIVEPGLIKSGFSEAAVSGMDGVPEAHVYAEFHQAVATATKESYEKGPMSKLSGVPHDVARVIEKAISVKSPKARYTVSASATLMLAQRRLLSDRVWDWVLKSIFPVPRIART